MATAQTKTERIALTAEEVANRYGITATTVHRWAQRGAMPPCRVLGRGVSRWMMADLCEWEASDFAKRLREATAEGEQR